MSISQFLKDAAAAGVAFLKKDSSNNVVGLKDGATTIPLGPSVNRGITASDNAIAVDNGGVITCTHAATPIVVTIPKEATVPWPAGAILTIYQAGAAAATFAAGANVMLHDTGPVSIQYGTIVAYRVAADEWTLV